MKAFTLIEHLEDLDAESKYLVGKAKEAATHAYAPYSKFLVGAALLMADGSVVTGVNQENAAYPSGMCAERVAIFSAFTLHPEMEIKKLVVVARKKSSKELSPAPCCGSCRQVLLEVENRQQSPIEIIMQSPERTWIKAVSAASLLPFGFTRTSLKKIEPV